MKNLVQSLVKYALDFLINYLLITQDLVMNWKIDKINTTIAYRDKSSPIKNPL